MCLIWSYILDALDLDPCNLDLIVYCEVNI